MRYGLISILFSFGNIQRFLLIDVPVKQCGNGAEIRYLDRRSAGFRLLDFMKDMLIRGRYCGLDSVFDERLK